MIKDTLDGIKTQIYKDFTVYVCHDGSDESDVVELEHVISEYQQFFPIVLIPYEPMTGIGHNKYKCVNYACNQGHDYIQMMDSDDYPMPRMLEANVERLDRGDVNWVLCWGRTFQDRDVDMHAEIKTFAVEADKNWMHSWICMKAKTFMKYPYRFDLKFAEDWDLWIRLFKDGIPGALVEEENYRYRFHTGQLTYEYRDNYPQVRQDIRKLNYLPKRKLRFHMLGLVHLPCSRQYMACAFTQKNYKMAQMLMSLGHEVFYYGAEGSDLSCTEHISTHSLSDIRKQWGDGDNRFEIGYDWKSGEFRHDFNTDKTLVTLKFYNNAIKAIKERANKDDFLLITQGYYHKTIADAVGLYLSCEPGIGYRGSYAQFRAFESAYIQNFTYGSQFPFESINGRYYDRVIPNYFDPQDFTVSDKIGDYYLYIGRMIRRKGILTAAKACNYLGKKLIIVGQGGKVDEYGSLSPADGSGEFILPKGTWEYRGFADVETRKKLMSEAIAVFTPTEYLEPFAGTHVEAMLSGTPPITTDFGVFPGTIPDSLNGIIGFRCNTLDDFIKAAKAAQSCDRVHIRQYGERFLISNVRWEFQKWFDDLYQLYLSTLDDNTKGWHFIDPET
jgi:glycosyltransferase involved in cell wall biosynthesis